MNYTREQLIEALWLHHFQIEHDDWTIEEWNKEEQIQVEFKDQFKDASVEDLVEEVEEWIDPDEDEDNARYSVKNFMDYFR